MEQGNQSGDLKQGDVEATGLPLKNVRDLVREQVIDQGCSVSELIKQNKFFFDKEKAAQIFNEEELLEIDGDLKELKENPYGITYEDEDYAKFLEANQDKLNKVLGAGIQNKSLNTSHITIKNDGNMYNVKNYGDVDDSLKKKIRDEIQKINIDLQNQKGLSKIWAIEDQRRSEESSNLTEEEAFNKELEKVDEKFYQDFRIFKKDFKYTIPSTCPTCKGSGASKLLFLKLKCFRCSGTGKVNLTPEEYYRTIRKDVEKEALTTYSREITTEDGKKINF